MYPSRWHLGLTMALAVAATAVVATGHNNDRWLSPLGVLLVLALPGYALSAALLPNLGWLERLLCAIGLSLVASILGGLVLNVTPWGLRALPWALWLCGITLASALAAVVMHRHKGAARTLQWPRISLRSALVFSLALTITVLAIGTAVLSGRESDSRFTQLWAVPTLDGQSHAVQIGVRNQEGKPELYRVTVDDTLGRVHVWENIAIEPGAEWTARLILADLSGGPLNIFLYRAESPGSAYRSVEISPATFAAP